MIPRLMLLLALALLPSASWAVPANRLLVAFCQTRSAVEQVAEAFADGQDQLALDILGSMPGCYASTTRLVVADGPPEVVGVVEGSEGNREILKFSLGGATVYSWRVPLGRPV